LFAHRIHPKTAAAFRSDAPEHDPEPKVSAAKVADFSDKIMLQKQIARAG
jgi:hypothetical protein